ncbi:MAG: hypothetical protein EB126_12160, partial [Synechococcaceae bacterium WBB_10_009]|nr:hypothetical protein [Synechococcaceae bacterium WBB_10_009]
MQAGMLRAVPDTALKAEAAVLVTAGSSPLPSASQDPSPQRGRLTISAPSDYGIPLPDWLQRCI